VNKQGKYFANISASTSEDPKGSGESAEIMLKGHARLKMGYNKNQKRSMTFQADGGIQTNWGFDNQNSRSWDAVFRGGVYWDILGSDSVGKALTFNVQGEKKLVVSGFASSDYQQNYTENIGGSKYEAIAGGKTEQVINNHLMSIGGNHNEIVTGHSDYVIGQGRSVTINSPGLGGGAADVCDILAGDRELNMLFGNKVDSLLQGDYQTNLLAGNREVNIVAGDYTVDVSAGEISITTSAGNITIEASTGTIDIEGLTEVNIISSQKVNVKAPLVNLGNKADGGVVNDGPAGHLDYITGQKLIGSKTVKCNSA
jgi:hypothetical protein